MGNLGILHLGTTLQTLNITAYHGSEKCVSQLQVVNWAAQVVDLNAAQQHGYAHV